MDEVQNQSEVAEVAPQETVQNETVQQTQEAPVEKETKQEFNWRELNRAKKDLERKLKLQEEANEKLMHMLTSPKQSQTVEEPEDPDDEFIPKGKVKKVAKKQIEPLEKKIQELEERLEQSRQIQFVNDLKRRYPDFDEVVNQETMALLEEKEPELAQTIVDLGDPIKMGVQTYKFIKAMNLQSKIPDARNARDVEKKLEKNAKTVQTPQAYDKRPLAQTFVLTDKVKSELWDEMSRFGAMAGGVPELS